MTISAQELMDGVIDEARDTGRLSLVSSLTLRDLERAGIDTRPVWRALWGIPEGVEMPKP